MNDNFLKIDLHIHTPASRCYKGKKDDGEYLNILGMAKRRGLRVIAVTDHNSIQGYKKITELKAKLINEKKALTSITDSEQLKEILKKLEKNLSLFGDILILPGIEFEVRNGIHILVIFDNNTRAEIIDKFLMDGGYSPQNFGEEEPSTLPNWDIFALFEECRKLNCLVIDAHTDSNKGILNTLPKGIQRASCFRSPQLCAVCYKNQEQIDKLKEVLRSAKEYQRQTPLSFVRFSDAHSAREVGSVFTWVRLDNVSFESLKNAFANPSELVSIEQPSLLRILNELLLKPNSFGIPDLSTNSIDLFKHCICGLHNSIGGNILFGVSERKNIKGLTEQIDQISKEISACFKDIDGHFRFKIIAYPLQGNRTVVSIRVPQGNNLISIMGDGRIYSLKDDKICVLSAAEVQAIVEDRLADEIGAKISKRLLKVEKDCQLIKNLFSVMPIMRKFEKNSVQARFDLDIVDSIALDVADIQKARNIPWNGTCIGNLFFVREESQSPRLQYTYLRYSTPLVMLRKMKQRTLCKDTTYIVPGGGTYFAKKDYPIFSDTGQKVIKLHKTPSNARHGIKFTVSFLKLE